ncbi:MAG: GatB/YqeY domain-containing protein [Alphaproteobacteria bacterium]
MLREKINETVKTAMRAKDMPRLSVLRMMTAAIKDKDIADRSNGNQDGIAEPQILALLQTMIKQRRESIKMYTEGKRADLVEKEEAEIVIIENFLPQQMDEDAVKKAITDAIAETGATTMKDMGKVIGILKGKYAGQIDFGKASGLVKAALN